MSGTQLKADFTLDSYTQLLERLLQAGYQFRLFPATVKEIAPEGVVYLRHDIDLDPMAALRLAGIEQALNIKATYFFMITSPIYNLMSPQCRSVICQTLRPRSAVSVHIDVGARLGAECRSRVTRDCAAFERYYGIPSNVVSFHRPSTGILTATDSAMLTWPRLHTYMPELFRDIGYFSDSGGMWRNYPLDSDEFKCGRSMQILVHPEWWQVTQQTAQERLEDLKRVIDQRFDSYIHSEFTKVFQNARN